MTPSSCAIERCAVIGAGVIGAGWAARFLLNGLDVVVHDPHPDAERRVRATLENATRARKGGSPWRPRRPPASFALPRRFPKPCGRRISSRRAPPSGRS